MTLEQLEEQQRMIWAALENADTPTSSDCETPALGTPAPSSPRASTPVRVGTEVGDAEEVPAAAEPVDSCHISPSEQQPGPQERSPQELGPDKGEDEGLEPAGAQEDAPKSPGQVIAEEDSPQSPDPAGCQVDRPQSSEAPRSQEGEAQAPVAEEAPDSASLDFRKVTAIPHRSFFAAGIVPFEDTPEFTEVAEATGTYLKIRDLLKSSPRNLGKKK